MKKISSSWLTAEKRVLEGTRSRLYDASEHEWHFCHHPALGVFNGRLYAMWSNGRVGEDEPGQRVLYAVTSDGDHWSAPQVLCASWPGSQGYEKTLTAVGFYAYEETLNAYIASYEYESYELVTDSQGNARNGKLCCNPMLYVMTSRDGEHWSEPQSLDLPLAVVCGPRKLRSGRLLMEGNWAHAYTDDPSGLSGWKFAGYCPDDVELEKPLRDDPTYFWKVAKAMNLEGHLCEGSFIEEKDGTLHMMYRSTFRPLLLWQTDSTDGGEHWSLPEKTDFPNGESKFHMEQLPDGRWAYVGNPEQDMSRCPLVVSISEDDGMTFTRHYMIETERVSRKFPGLYKGGIYGYPHMTVYGDSLYVIYSIWKEDVAVHRIPFACL